MTEHHIRRRWARGVRLLELSRAEPELMGPSLLALHATIETWLRLELAARHDLTEEEREKVEQRQLTGPALLLLAQRYLGISRDELDALAQVNADRRTLLRGDPYPGNAAELANYAALVAQRCGLIVPPPTQPEPVDPAEPEVPRPRRIRRTPARRGPTARTTVPYLSAALPAWLGMRQLVFLGCTLLLLGLFSYALYTSFIGETRTTVTAQISDAAPAAPPPPPTATPLPPQRTARIARLNGAIGFLRDAPTFASGTLPPRLQDGVTVVLRDEPTVDADGTTWQLVSLTGYDGWCPTNNLDVTP